MNWTGYYVFSFGEHAGSINISKGELSILENEIIGGSFEIDMKSMKDLDMPAEDGGNDLVEHLKSDDFFSVDKFPVSTFRITKVEKIKDALPDHYNVDITGVLTLKGVSNALTFPARIILDSSKVKANARFKFDRTKWGVHYNSGKIFSDIGDGAISDAIGLEMEIVALKK